MTKRFHLENRYQDSGWERLSGEEFNFLETAIDRAQELSEDAICYGMVRVMEGSRVVVIFPAGGGKPRRGPTTSVDLELSALSGRFDPPEAIPPIFWDPSQVILTLGVILIPQVILALGIYSLGNPTRLDDGIWSLIIQVAWPVLGALVVGPVLEGDPVPSDAHDSRIEMMAVILSFYLWPLSLVSYLLVRGRGPTPSGKAKVTDPEI